MKSFSFKIIFLLVLFCSSVSLSFDEPQEIPPIKIKLQLITKGLTSPVGMASPHDGTNRIFIIEQGGKIKIVKNGTLLSTPFLNISHKLDGLNIAYSEKGLLGLVFHPDYKTNGRFFVYYSAPTKEKNSDHKSVLASYKVSAANPDVADTKEEVIMEILQPESNHNGGCLQFGKDGFLYIGVGDGGGAGDKHGTIGNGQNLNTLLGKILRIDVDSKKPYAIPPDNPFVGRNNAKPEIYAYGLRNPWRFSFDRVSGKLFCADVGQDAWEEINLIEKGKNYGWRIMEGKHCYNPNTNCNTSGLTLPIDEYNHDTGISVCGGSVYRGKMYPSLHGIYFFADWSGKIFCLRQQGDGSWRRGEVIADDNRSNDMGSKINSMGEDGNGEIYFITQNLFGPKSPTGAVYRMGL
ncbi:MAG TPA: PQQ-dependent sugar dehydrogenase [Bacteroidia bacterium]|nr:PQQ-dependent sugar dehydrogenase [Bacteroidia bacterium]